MGVGVLDPIQGSNAIAIDVAKNTDVVNNFLFIFSLLFYRSIRSKYRGWSGEFKNIHKIYKFIAKIVSDCHPGLVPCTTDPATVCGVTVKRARVTVKKRLSLFDESANRAVFVFVPAGFAVGASKVNNLQMTLFPFAFGKSFF